MSTVNTKVSIYFPPPVLAAARARAIEDERTLSACVARIVRDAVSPERRPRKSGGASHGTPANSRVSPRDDVPAA
jgi:hypothetical protein